MSFWLLSTYSLYSYEYSTSVFCVLYSKIIFSFCFTSSIQVTEAHILKCSMFVVAHLDLVCLCGCMHVITEKQLKGRQDICTNTFYKRFFLHSNFENDKNTLQIRFSSGEQITQLKMYIKKKTIPQKKLISSRLTKMP